MQGYHGDEGSPDFTKSITSDLLKSTPGKEKQFFDDYIDIDIATVDLKLETSGRSNEPRIRDFNQEVPHPESKIKQDLAMEDVTEENSIAEKSELDISLAKMTKEYNEIRPQYSDSQFPSNLDSILGTGNSSTQFLSLVMKDYLSWLSVESLQIHKIRASDSQRISKYRHQHSSKK